MLVGISAPVRLGDWSEVERSGRGDDLAGFREPFAMGFGLSQSGGLN
jgi:hypothetical protein